MPGPMAMERPPQPPEVAAQQAPFSQVGGMMGQQAAAGNPLLSAFAAVSKVIEQMAKMAPPFAPYAQRMMAIGKAGIEEMAKSKGGAEQGPPMQGGEAPPPAGPPPGDMPA